MSVTTGSGLTNQTDVIDAIRAHLATDGWTVSFDNLSVGGNTGELWVGLAAADTFNGLDMHFGLTISGSDSIALNCTPLAPADALITGVSPRNVFLRVLGCPNINLTNPTGNSGDTWNGVALGSSTNATPSLTNGFDQGGSPYLRHWILTPPINSPLGAQEMYCYCVVEIDTNVFRSLYFGEMIKLGGSGWVGGQFVTGTFNHATESRREYPFGAGQDYNSFGHSGQFSFLYNESNFNYNADSPVFWTPWVTMFSPPSGNAPALIGMDPRKLGSDYIDFSPAAFSGQTQRIPARLYETANDTSSGQNQNFRPVCEGPDFFFANIRDITPGDVIVDDAENFLAFPILAKSGANNSGDFGIMIRNPDL